MRAIHIGQRRCDDDAGRQMIPLPRQRRELRQLRQRLPQQAQAGGDRQRQPQRETAGRGQFPHRPVAAAIGRQRQADVAGDDAAADGAGDRFAAGHGIARLQIEQFARRDQIAIHAHAHGAAGIAPFESGLRENFVDIACSIISAT